MADNRRKPPHRSRPRGASGPGRAGHGASGGAGAEPTTRTTERPRVPDADPAAGGTPRRPRFTGRAVILMAVLAVLLMSFASSMRAFLQQREHIGDLKAQIAMRQQSIDQLEREKKRWSDDAYVKAQARERFGYLMPGETGFQVIDENGDPLDPGDSLSAPGAAAHEPPVAWWHDAWGSVELAGDPPGPRDGPADRIGAPGP